MGGMLSCSKAMKQNLLPSQQRTPSSEKVGIFRLTRSITGPYHKRTLISEGRNPEKNKTESVCFKSLKNIRHEECNFLLLSMDGRLDASMCHANKYLKNICSFYIAQLKMW